MLGHWGTSGGLSLAYIHTQALIARKGREEGKEPHGLFVTGPGHVRLISSTLTHSIEVNLSSTNRIDDIFNRYLGSSSHSQ